MKPKPIIILLAFLLVVIAVIKLLPIVNGLKPALLPPNRQIAGEIPAAPPTTSPSLAPGVNQTNLPLTIPNGFTLNYFAQNLGSPRDLIDSPTGTLIASLTTEGKVIALPDTNQDGVADTVEVILSGLNEPHGLAFRCPKPATDCQLYVAQTNALYVYTFNPQTNTATNPQKLVSLPGGGRHFTRSLLMLPDNQHLLISIGSSCNVCVESNPLRASIQVLHLTTNTLSPYATGLRNSVFMTLNPQTLEVWATEMGRDYLGDNLPPEEVNIIQPEGNYGWPWCYDNRTPDSSFDPSGSHAGFCQTTIPPHLTYTAHAAPLGLAFVPSQNPWPSPYQGNLLVAFHGSWNRTVPDGYKLVRYALDNQGNQVTVDDFITGWLSPDGSAFGRPVDVLPHPDGTLFISDDKLGAIYRLSVR